MKKIFCSFQELKIHVMLLQKIVQQVSVVLMLVVLVNLVIKEIAQVRIVQV
jgi:hypothetical protein